MKWLRQMLFSIPQATMMHRRYWKLGCFEVTRDGIFLRKSPKLSPRDQAILVYLSNSTKVGRMQMYLECAVCGEGPKVFEVPDDACSMLEMWENMKLRIPMSQFAMPFPTVCIEFPDNYAKRRLVPNAAWRDCQDHPGRNQGEKHSPVLAIVRFEKDLDVIFVSVGFDSATSCCMSLDRRDAPDGTLEDLLKLAETRDRDGRMEASDEEWAEAVTIARACLNACLFFCEPSTVLDSTLANPSFHRRLLRQGHHDQAATIPWLYTWSGFNRHRKLYAPKSVSNGESGGRTVRPHWREGHWTMQPYGPMVIGEDGKKHWGPLRRRTRIDALLVHGSDDPPPVEEEPLSPSRLK
jgi:hypothetical protein